MTKRKYADFVTEQKAAGEQSMTITTPITGLKSLQQCLEDFYAKHLEQFAQQQTINLNLEIKGSTLKYPSYPHQTKGSDDVERAFNRDMEKFSESQVIFKILSKCSSLSITSPNGYGVMFVFGALKEAARFPKLERIEIKGVTSRFHQNANTNVLEALSELPNLKFLSFEGSTAIKWKALESLVPKLSKLEHIDLCNTTTSDHKHTSNQKRQALNKIIEKEGLTFDLNKHSGMHIDELKKLPEWLQNGCKLQAKRFGSSFNSNKEAVIKAKASGCKITFPTNVDTTEKTNLNTSHTTVEKVNDWIDLAQEDSRGINEIDKKEIDLAGDILLSLNCLTDNSTQNPE